MFSRELGFDLGTSVMHISQRDKGIILDEPEIIAIDKKSGDIIAVGEEAYDMLEKTPSHILMNNPVNYGVVADFDNMAKLLKCQLRKLKMGKKFSNNVAIVSVPHDVSEVERKALYDLFVHSGFRFKRVYLIEKSVAAAVGAGIEVLQPYGNMIVDIGGGTTEVSVVSLGGIVISKLLKVGGNKFDEDIKSYIKRKYSIYIGKKSAEKIKKEIGYVFIDDENDIVTTEVVGRDVVTGLPKRVTVTNEDINDALQEDINIIIDAVKFILEKTPPELSSDILETGVYLTGGSSLLGNLDMLITNETSLSINLVENPKECVVNGIDTILRDLQQYEEILVSSKRETRLR
ncbi:rod shape-determining protein [Vallitalea longa]|uniref:Cell shape-determining protein MreB n=1 Tax=Vallitalea longa TaxID=2936439 RepID=A0A9W5YAE0_9FIRM|nr:rod shape-determining protein [Vallitalea longa]GKX28871.1 rod shape-determining protein [Vallitalea longa]